MVTIKRIAVWWNQIWLDHHLAEMRIHMGAVTYRNRKCRKLMNRIYKLTQP